MTRIRWQQVAWTIAGVCSVAVPLAMLYPSAKAGTVLKPQPVAAGDREIVWLHTTTNSTTWERFVAAWQRLALEIPGLVVDDSLAFQLSTTSIPELTIAKQGHDGKLRIRWYKLRSDATAEDWIRALAARNPAPLAIIGGGSTDRAVDLALALKRQTDWHGDRPLLLVTTATADRVAPIDDTGLSPKLVDVYDEKTFRFCFSNRQMAEAVLDFVGQQPALRPKVYLEDSLAGLASGLVNAVPTEWSKPEVLSLVWNDDPYSTDLHDQFLDLLHQPSQQSQLKMPIRPQTWTVEYSVGGATRTNDYESRAVDSIISHMRDVTPQRSLLVLPAVVQPSKRVLQAIVDRQTTSPHQLVVITGDGISANAILRDGDYSWPVGSLRVPLLFFSHSNPVGWDDTLRPPNSTEEIFHFVEMSRVIEKSVFGEQEIIGNPSELRSRIRARTPPYFDNNGERLGGTGEYVVWLSPGENELTAWRRDADRAWKRVRSVSLRSKP